MKFALVVLAICTALAGFVPISSWITSDGVPLKSHIDVAFSALPVLMALCGIGVATYLYKTEKEGRNPYHLHSEECTVLRTESFTLTNSIYL